MSILVFAEHDQGVFKKSTYEALSYAKDLAASHSWDVVAICMGNTAPNLSELGKYGADKIICLNSKNLDHFSPQGYAIAMAKIAGELNASVIVISGTYNGKSIAPRIAARLKAGIVSGVISLPDANFNVKKSAFSNKASVSVHLNSPIKVYCLVPNSYQLNAYSVNPVVENQSVEIGDDQIQTKTLNSNKASGKIPLTEAEIVVSAGRGLKGPENWGMVEELAALLGAATACSKPVADMDWRPHEEHVGQTGITIKPNLYIAVGISGAIQHLAGVSSSKVICVINKDAEAPFFKAADYGIVGDAFEVLPKLIERARQLKQN